ncbi:hypothetical protein, conserved [Eimeria praecox]|uniref:Uncharacterized protein n=1 Tax=Eimeria praecox TaxID=51316 RepID=U6H2N9_9EIME|nr:hypothetical protein, conserved [Eimeria praecox]
MQGNHKKDLKTHLARLLKDEPHDGLDSLARANPSQAGFRTSLPCNGLAGPLLLLERQMRIDLPTAISTGDCTASSMPKYAVDGIALKSLRNLLPRRILMATTEREQGNLQLWLLADGIQQPGLSTEWTLPHASLALEFSCATASEFASPAGGFAQSRRTREDPKEGLSNLSLPPKSSRLCLARRTSVAPDVQVQVDAILQEREDLQEELHALLGRISATPALRGLETEAAQVDANVRMLANQRAVASREQMQQHLLLLQHAFVAFRQNLVQHLQASTLAAPKELSVAAENTGETITAKTYLSLRQRPKEKALSTKILFLRKVQTDESL